MPVCKRFILRLRSLLNSRKGESLIEVVVSVAIFGILIVVATTMLMSSLGIASKADQMQKGDAKITEYYDGGESDPANGATPKTESTMGDSVIVDFKDGILLEGTKKFIEYDPDKGTSLRRFTFELKGAVTPP